MGLLKRMKCEELFGRMIDDCSIGRVQNLFKRIKRKELLSRRCGDWEGR